MKYSKLKIYLASGIAISWIKSKPIKKGGTAEAGWSEFVTWYKGTGKNFLMPHEGGVTGINRSAIEYFVISAEEREE